MITRHSFVLCMFALLLVAGCASTEIYNRKNLVTGPIPRPAHVWVYDFGATPEDVQADSALAGQYLQDAAYQNKEQIKTGRKLGAQIATELVKQIRDMGMPAEHAVAGTSLQINDIILRGYLVSFDEGDATKRVVIGFGSGSSNMKVTVESFQVTADGLRKLGYGSASAGANKTPGAAVGAAAFIATANPAGLIVSTGMKVYGEKSGKSKVEGRADQIAKEIADVLKERFQEQGWIK
jgi:hypothetical protein